MSDELKAMFLAHHSSLITHHLPNRRHVAGADDARLPRVSFYTQSAVWLKAARRTLEGLFGERDAHATAAREGRARLPLAQGQRFPALGLKRLVAAGERARERGEQALAVGRAPRLLFDG